MLNSIFLNNFKAAKNLKLTMSPLTMLAGLNGSGKSTVLQSIAAIYQTYLTGEKHGMQLSGPLVPLGQGRDILSEGASDYLIIIALEEDAINYRWACHSMTSEDHLEFLDANQLKFSELPTTPPQFIMSSHFQYLQADRIVPHTLYPQANQQSQKAGFLGSHGEFTIDFLARNSSNHVSKNRQCDNNDGYIDDDLWAQITSTSTLSDQVAGWLQQISPGVHLQAETLKGTDEVILQFRYMGTNSGTSTSYRPTHVGFGLTYCLPIVVACLAAHKDSLLLIENPEAHLHPLGQAKMGELLALCAADGVQILVETHSDHILNGVRLAVKKKILPADNTNMHFFTRDIASGECYVESPAILPDGQLTNWPKGFFDQWGKDLDALLD